MCGVTQTLIPTPTKSDSTLSLKLAQEGGPPGLTSTSPSTTDPDTPTLKSVKIEGVSPMPIVVPCLKGLSGPIEVPEPDLLSSSDSEPELRLEISLTPCTEATDAAIEGREDSTQPDLEAVQPASETSSASGKDNENPPTDEFDIVVPATDANIAAALEFVRSSWEH